jgi:hypothetical protein
MNSIVEEILAKFFIAFCILAVGAGGYYGLYRVAKHFAPQAITITITPERTSCN